ncbi:hypothetical protein C4D60_Mb02t09150 [Musa balbisiana]|uniref:non-specific serine/threonine protein kinase n=1 Tax=Musa balbisiana TaxID=52838 RepID=A0A4S8I9D1_MUSBA|nr:hypothetical protein C4D60_Mb02t09150 [Musa balbisiana]
MGNCLDSSSGVENPQTSRNASYVSRTSTSKTSLSSFPSTLTCSTPSNLSAPHYKEHTASGALPTPRTEREILSSANLKDFAFSDLKSATRNFRADSLIGEGGFGCVYKGWIDEQSLAPSKPGSGMVVAIKKLKPEGFQGHKEWLTEVNYLGQLHHPNLVKLIGYCSEGDNRLLVYELMLKGSLESHLFRRSVEPLPWATRIKVAIGAARGLSFLNDECQIIYRDLKASNILLDTDFNVKLSDFGLAKDGPTGDRTHVSTQVMGTYGYAAPEYIATGRLNAKADVYSFGVLLLELLTGRRALDKIRVAAEQNLVDWTRPCLGDKRKLHRIIDPRLEGRYPKNGAHEFASLALQCIRNDAKLRPNMSEVLASLEKLQDPKYAALPPQSNQKKRSSSTMPRSPMRNPRPPLRPTPSGSSLPSYRA